MGDLVKIINMMANGIDPDEPESNGNMTLLMHSQTLQTLQMYSQILWMHYQTLLMHSQSLRMYSQILWMYHQTLLMHSQTLRIYSQILRMCHQTLRMYT